MTGWLEEMVGRAGGKRSRVRLFPECKKMLAHCETVYRGGGERIVRWNGHKCHY